MSAPSSTTAAENNNNIALLDKYDLKVQCWYCGMDLPMDNIPLAMAEHKEQYGDHNMSRVTLYPKGSVSPLDMRVARSDPNIQERVEPEQQEQQS